MPRSPARRAIVDAMVSSFISKTVPPEVFIRQLLALPRYEPKDTPALHASAVHRPDDAPVPAH